MLFQASLNIIGRAYIERFVRALEDVGEIAHKASVHQDHTSSPFASLRARSVPSSHVKCPQAEGPEERSDEGLGLLDKVRTLLLEGQSEFYYRCPAFCR